MIISYQPSTIPPVSKKKITQDEKTLHPTSQRTNKTLFPPTIHYNIPTPKVGKKSTFKKKKEKKDQTTKIVNFNMTGYRGPHQISKAEMIISLNADIYGLTEHWLMLEDKIDDIEGYEWFGINRPSRKNAIRGEGGVGFLIRKTIAHLVQPLVSDVEDMYMISIGDTYLCLVYIQPIKSKQTINKRAERIWDRVQVERQKCPQDKNFILLGDPNARTGEENDWVKVSDLDTDSDTGSDSEQDDDDPQQNSHRNSRCSEDKGTNINGVRLLQYCKDFDDRILNGRMNGTAKYTFTGQFGKSVIDLFVANRQAYNACSDLQIHDELLKSKYSGHFPVSLNVNIKDLEYNENSEPLTRTPKRPNLKKADWTSYNNCLDSHSKSIQTALASTMQNLKSSNDRKQLVNDLWDLIKSTLCTAESMSVPKTEPNNNQNRRNPTYYQKWFDKDCNILRVELGIARQQSKHNHNKLDHYIMLDKEYTKICRQKKRDYEAKTSIELEQDLFKNTEDFWSKYKRMNRKKKEPIPWSAKDENGVIHTGIKSTLQIWGNIYQFLCSETEEEFVDSENAILRSKMRDSIKEYTTQSASSNDKQDELHLLTAPCNLKELQALIMKIKNRKAPGMDNIRPELLKHLPDSFLSILVDFFNLLIEHELTPTEWGKGEIKPIFKSDDNRSPLNYRPITLLPITGKLFSSLINQRLYEWVEKHSSLSEEQGGFRNKRSCEDQALTLSELIKLRLGKGKKSFTCFVDFRKAFDSVYRDGLWIRLWRSGVKDKIWRTLRSIYDKTSAVLNINGEMTTEIKCNVGIRQGCPLSPLLFSIFINQLIEDLKDLKIGINIDDKSNDTLSCLLFADDVVLLAETAEELQILISKVNDYCCLWKMAVNVKKTKIVIFGQTIEDENLSFSLDIKEKNSPKIQIVDRYKYLGIIFTNDLSWKPMINFIKDSSRRKTFALMTFAIRNDLRSAALLEFLFRTTIRPALEYGVSLWGFAEHPELESIQLMFGRFILGVSQSTANHAVRGELGWFNLHSRRQELILRNYHRVSDFKPSRLLSRIITLSDKPNRRPSWTKKVNNMLKSITKNCQETPNSPKGISVEQFLNLDSQSAKIWAKSAIQCIHRNQWFNQIKIMSSLSTYIMIKRELKFESYLRTPHLTSNQKSQITKMRLGDNNLRICTGRRKYQYEEHDDRLCTLCENNEVESESHFLLHCPFYSDERNFLIEKFFDTKPNESDLLRLMLLDSSFLCSEQIMEVCPSIYIYLKKTTEKRTKQKKQII
eukprot:Lithocolla_globosa_v1_NODE_382_length_4223_cov_41.541747.p1 type:complete len:1269 gc:universal NODE_382_length_4223_cov_41.541747:343-4149(+)